ncbi:MAG: hypothetical protein KDD49_06700, partial [Bacteroidetes bacterium]|nr:hypothetical protein [Bacteroidota bacterium]
IKNDIFNNPTITRICKEATKNKLIYPKKGFLQVVGSELKKHNAENSKLRLDCNLEIKYKDKFIYEIKEVVNEENIDVFFFLRQRLSREN